MKAVYIDYEYNHSKDPVMNVVSVAYQIGDSPPESKWLFNCDNMKLLHKQWLEQKIEEGYIFVAHNAQAEARAMHSCGLNIKTPDLKFIDTFLEYRCLTNHNDRLMWGKQLIDGRERYTKRPKYGKKKVDNSKPQHSLAATTYKLLDTDINLKHKDHIRDIIIGSPTCFTQEQKRDILAYNESDIKYLERIFLKEIEWYERLLGNRFDWFQLKEEMLLRGDFSRRSAIMETLGYPINYEAAKAFSEQVEDILNEVAQDVNSQFDFKPFTFDVKTGKYKKNTKVIKEWIHNSKYKNKWTLTDQGDYSLSLDAFGDHFRYSHTYPRNNFGAQFLKYLKTSQNMNGFRSTAKGKKSFWDSVGSDRRVRPYLNPYGSQTARTQPAATGFIPLKAAWMRSLIQPPKGRAMAGLDYGSQEFLISALVSQDMKMVEAYKSGDVYLHFAKEIGMVPPEGTKKTHPQERQICKSTVLGISYSMTSLGLGAKLRSDLDDETFTDKDAQNLIDKFNDTYSDFYKWKQSINGYGYFTETEEGEKWVEHTGMYEKQKFLKLPCGWYLWGDNDNPRSVGNFPIQGMGSSILRKAVSLAQDEGLDIPFTLHDAVYLEYDSMDVDKIGILEKCMRDAFVFYFPEDMKKYAKLIRIDGETWSPDYEGLNSRFFTHPVMEHVKVETIHIDERNVNEYEKFKKYFKPNNDWKDL